MDFGAFDASCTKQVRDMIENMVLTNLFQSLLGDGKVMTSAKGQKNIENFMFELKSLQKECGIEATRRSAGAGQTLGRQTKVRSKRSSKDKDYGCYVLQTKETCNMKLSLVRHDL